MTPSSDNWNNLRPKEREDLVAHWRSEPTTAALEILNVDLDSHQQVVVDSRWVHDVQYDILSRGTGKTYVNATTASLGGILYPGNRIGLIAPSFRQSKMIFRELEEMWNQSNLFQSCTDRPPAWTPEECYVKFTAAPGHKPSWISALPLGTDGSKIRGSRFFWAIADELAQIEEDILETVVFGFMATNRNPMENVRRMREQRKLIAAGKMKEEDLVRPEANKFFGSSTAYYQYNHLWRRVQKVINDLLMKYRTLKKSGLDDAQIRARKLVFKGGSLNNQIPHRYMSDGTQALSAFTYKDISEGFMAEKTIENAKLTMSEYKFLMEYMAFFPPDSEGFFRRFMLDKAREHRRFGIQMNPRPGMIYVMGVDPARTSDNFSTAIMEVDPDRMCANLVLVRTWNQKSFPFMHHEIRKLIRHYGIRRFKMDAGGGGTTIRDLLADQQNCPPGDTLILEQDFEEHKAKIGRKLLAPLVQFSSSQWVHDANHNLKSAIEHNRLFIAAPHGTVPGDVMTSKEIDDVDRFDEEMEDALVEWSSIVLTLQGNREHFDTPTKTQRKDRYSAILMCYDAAHEELMNLGRPKTLAGGFWGGASLIGR